MAARLVAPCDQRNRIGLPARKPPAADILIEADRERTGDAVFADHFHHADRREVLVPPCRRVEKIEVRADRVSFAQIHLELPDPVRAADALEKYDRLAPVLRRMDHMEWKSLVVLTNRNSAGIVVRSLIGPAAFAVVFLLVGKSHVHGVPEIQHGLLCGELQIPVDEFPFRVLRSEFNVDGLQIRREQLLHPDFCPGKFPLRKRNAGIEALPF